MIEEISAGTVPFNGVIWDEFSEATSTPKKNDVQCPISTFLVQIRCTFNAQFGWGLFSVF